MQNQIEFNSYIDDNIRATFSELAKKILVDLVVDDKGIKPMPVVWLIDYDVRKDDYHYYSLCPASFLMISLTDLTIPLRL